MQTLASLFAMIAYVSAGALHLFTLYIAFRMSGFLAGAATFFLPFFAEIFWFFAVWRKTGTLANYFTVGCVVVVGCFALSMIFASLADKKELKHAARK